MLENNMQNIRDSKNKTQLQVAELMNISRSSYAMWESCNHIIPIKRLLDFCELFDVSVDNALGLSHNNYEITSRYDQNKSSTRIKEVRREFKLSQEKLANLWSVKQATCSLYENGKAIIATESLYIICKKYGISADYLLGRIDEPKYLKNTKK